MVIEMMTLNEARDKIREIYPDEPYISVEAICISSRRIKADKERRQTEFGVYLGTEKGSLWANSLEDLLSRVKAQSEADNAAIAVSEEPYDDLQHDMERECELDEIPDEEKISQ